MKKLIFLLILVGLLVVFLLSRQFIFKPSLNPPINAVEDAPLVSQASATSSQVTPDGKSTVSVHADGLYVNDQLIFSADQYPAGELTPVFNTWSPNSKYFFLVQKEGSNRHYLVFKADGSPFSPTNSYLDINEYFVSAFPDYTLIETTGWASPFLLVVNAEEKSSGNKISLWFDLTTFHFIRLSNYFE